MSDATTAGEHAGRGIIRFGWVANVVFVVTAVPAAAGVDAFEGVAIAVALLLFVVGMGAFVYAFAVAAARSANGDNVAVANLYFLQGSAPRPVQRQFLAMFLVCFVVAVATVVWAPFGFLVPMLPLGLAGVWAARYGTFPPRLPTTRR
ncbi:MAG TPA: hypothetical protein VFZ17_05760 [Acidimicrobiia bacterium]|nr:hypothetical protein [Acidimicrobiia bacterium]